MQIRDIYFLALRSITANRLRTFLTVGIIAFGIFSLVGTLTVIDVLKHKIYDSFANMGANGFTIRNRELNIQIGGRGNATRGSSRKLKVRNSNKNKVITFQEAMAFKEKYDFPATVGVSFRAGGGMTVYKDDKKTNPTVQVIGGDENYLQLSNYDLLMGRNFNKTDIESGRNVAILGNDVVKKLFPNRPEYALNTNVRVGNVRYRVIGILQTKGSSNLFSADNVVVTTVTSTRRVFNRPNATYMVNVSVNDISKIDAAIGEATGTFRVIRKMTAGEDNNFYMSRSDSVAEMLFNSLSTVTLAAGLIAFITLFGSAIGLMNIMLVAVAERTREIGVSKALGATSSTIKRQFIAESIFISLLGGICGVLLGIMVGMLIAGLMNTAFVVPWLWIFIGITLCATVGLISGIYPAMKASKLDPIVALRYE